MGGILWSGISIHNMIIMIYSIATVPLISNFTLAIAQLNAALYFLYKNLTSSFPELAQVFRVHD